jgi:hypothetical protein
MDKEGISIDRLAPGTTITIKTTHSEYTIKLGNTPREVLFSGGSGIVRYPTPVQGYFLGTGDGWIHKDIAIKLIVDDKTITTSPVKDVEVVAPDGSWQYYMHWSDNE